MKTVSAQPNRYMPKLNFPLLVVSAFLVVGIGAVQARQASCEKRIKVFAESLKISGIDSAYHKSMRKYMRNYLISQQQHYNYQLTNTKEEAPATIRSSIKLLNPEGRDHRAEFALFLVDTTDSNNIIGQQSLIIPSRSQAQKPGQKLIPTDGFEFLTFLQERDSWLGAAFGIDKDHISQYQHAAPPTLTVVLGKFDMDQATLGRKESCFRQEIMKHMKLTARFKGQRINVGYSENPPPRYEGVPVLEISATIREQAGYYVLEFHADSQPYIHETSFQKHLIDKDMEHPFANEKLNTAGTAIILFAQMWLRMRGE